MRGKKASLAILLLATLLAAFAATGTAPAVAYTSGAVSGDKITYDGTNWKSLSDAAASGDTVGDVTVDGTLPVTIPEGLKVTGSIYNDKGVLLTVNGEQELNVESSDINVRGVFVSGDKSAVSFGNFNSVSVSADNGAGRGLYAGFGGSVSGDLSSVTVKASAGARGIFAYNSDMKLKMNGDMLVSSPNNYADGIRADNGSSVDVSGLKSMTVTAGSGNAEGILTNRSNVSIKMNGDMSVSSSNSYADGIWVSNGSSVDVSGLKSITVKASSDANSTAVAVAAVIYSKLNLAMDGDTYVSNTSGANVFGITSELGASLNLAGMKSLVVSSNRGNAYGINAFHSSLSSDLAHLTVTAGSGYADGILTNSSDASLKMNGDMLVSSSNNYANGIWAYNGSSVDVYGLKSMTVTAGNGYADGVKTNSSDASLKMNGDMLVSSSNNYADGIWADNGSSVDVSGLKSMAVSANISNETDYATGASVSKRSKLNLAMDGDMSVHNTGLVYGATADGGSRMNFSGIKAMAVSSDNGTAYGVSASNSSAVNGSLSSMTVQASGDANGVKTDSSDISLNMNGDMSVYAAESGALGIMAQNNSNVKFAGVKALTVSSDNGQAYGIHASDSSVSGGLDSMKVSAKNSAYGVSAYSSSADLIMNGDISVYSAESEAYGVQALKYSGENASVKFAGVKAMSVSSDSDYYAAYGIRASDSTANGSLDSMKVSAKYSAYGVYADSSSVDVTMTGDMTVKGSRSSTAIDAKNGSTVTVTGAARHKIAIDSEVSTDSVLRLSDGSTINVSNADVLNLGKTKVNSITAKNDGSSSEDIVNASNSYIKGNVAFYDASGEDSESYTGPSFVTGVSSELGSGSLTVNLKDGSTLEGAANAYDGDAIGGILSVMAATTPSGAVNINVFDTSKWLVTGDSNLGKGTLANNGTVAFSEDGAFKTVYVNKLAGVNGVYEMSTNGTNSDQIIAETKDSSASGVIHASAKSGSSATYQKRVATPFITVKNEESTSFTLAGGSLSIGAWNYVLRSGLTAGGQTEWYLASDPQNPVSPLALAATAAVVMPDVWYLETNALYSQANSFNADREDTTVLGSGRLQQDRMGQRHERRRRRGRSCKRRRQ